jgi:hypothetical protein
MREGQAFREGLNPRPPSSIQSAAERACAKLIFGGSNNAEVPRLNDLWSRVGRVK